MKLNRVLSLLLCVVLTAALCAMPTRAAGGITITSVTFEPYEDAYGGRNDNYVKVNIAFTAPANMAQMK